MDSSLEEKGVSNGSPGTTPKASSWTRTKKITVGVIVAVVILGIALGVGLGVGLNRGSGDDTDATNPGQEELEALREEYNLPALAIGVNNGTDFRMAVVGVRKYNTTEPLATVNDAWHIGSVTKSMTALLMASFVKEGTLSWDTTITEAVPDLAAEIHPDYANVTIAMLTSHHSGINSTLVQNDTSFLYSLYNTSDPVEARRIFVTRAFSEAPAFPANTAHYYDNLNYVMVGLILDLVTNETWESHMRTRLFETLNMTSCGFGTPPETNDTSIDNPWGHGTDQEDNPVPAGGPLGDRDYPTAYGPAGAVHCSIDDLRRYVELHIGGALGTAPSWYNLTTEDFAFLHATYQIGDDGGQYTAGGLEHPTPNTWWHNGSNNLYAAYMWFEIGNSVEESQFVIATTNRGDGMGLNAVARAVRMARNDEIDLFPTA